MVLRAADVRMEEVAHHAECRNIVVCKDVIYASITHAMVRYTMPARFQRCDMVVWQDRHNVSVKNEGE